MHLIYKGDGKVSEESLRKYFSKKELLEYRLNMPSSMTLTVDQFGKRFFESKFRKMEQLDIEKKELSDLNHVYETKMVNCLFL